MVGLADKARNYPHQLSGGQQQRIAIARCLAMEPDIMLLDEPTSALDPVMTGEVLSIVRKLTKMGLTMLIVTHEMDFAREVADRIFFVDDGVIYEEGSPEAIFDHPQREKTRTFISRLKTFYYEIRSSVFDIVSMNAGIEHFCRKHAVASSGSTAYNWFGKKYHGVFSSAIRAHNPISALPSSTRKNAMRFPSVLTTELLHSIRLHEVTMRRMIWAWC